MAQSILSLKKQLTNDPNNAMLLGALAEAYRTKGRIPLAIKTYSQLIENASNNYQALNNYGTLQRNIGNTEESLKALLKANNILPNNPIILTNLSNTFLTMGRPDLAVEYCQHAVNIQPDFFDSNEMLGNACIASGKYKSAVESYKKALQLQPKNDKTLTSLARAYHFLGENDNAYKLIQPLLKKKSSGCATLFFNISKKINKQKEAVEYIHNILKKVKGISGPDIGSLYFCMGKYYNETGLYDKAIKAYHHGNTLCNFQYSISETRKKFSDIISSFPNNTRLTKEKIAQTKASPIFILGMPRSGTTLIEQILSSHPDVYGAGELNDIHILATEVMDETATNPFISLSQLSISESEKISTKYLKQLKKLANQEAYITDKMPHNFIYIGFILKLFPTAHIIVCNRHPLDICLSCYFSEFGNNSHHYTYSLNNLGKYYCEYDRLITHWKNLYGDNIHNIYYEKLISNTEEESRKLLDVCGLEWHNNCLEFYKSTRSVSTLSYDQVNKPIYTDSMFKWKKYQNLLGKLPDTLSTIIKKYDSNLNNSEVTK